MQNNAVAGIRNHDQQLFLCCIYEGMLYGWGNLLSLHNSVSAL